MPNSSSLQDIRSGNLSDLGFDLSRSLKLKCDWILHIRFLVDIYSNCMSISRSLALITAQNVSSYLLSLGPNYEKKMKVTPK